MKQYTCILFDLDHTLWDFESNSEETLKELFLEYDLGQKGINGFSFFYQTFCRVNTKLWDLHDRNIINSEDIRQQRFHKVFTEAGLDDYPLSLKFSADFLRILPKKKNLVPHAMEILQYLQPKYNLTIVTNGFDELQSAKMISAGIHTFFKTIVTSQRVGNKKPSREIFDFALTEAGHQHCDTIMIGDNLQTDIAGARQAGVDTVYYNPSGTSHEEKVTYEIRSLKELTKLL